MDAVAVNEQWCKGCGICVAFCSGKALELKHEKVKHDPATCLVCGMCELYCPDLAIVVDRSQKPKKAKGEAA